MKTRASYYMTVRIRDEDSQREEEYFLVPATEENWLERKISMYHPVGKAIFSKEVDQVVSVLDAKGSNKRYRILQIEPT